MSKVKFKTKFRLTLKLVLVRFFRVWKKEVKDCFDWIPDIFEGAGETVKAVLNFSVGIVFVVTYPIRAVVAMLVGFFFSLDDKNLNRLEVKLEQERREQWGDDL